MKSKKIVPFIAVIASIPLSACGLFSKFSNGLQNILKGEERVGDEISGIEDDKPIPEKKFKYTIMYYMCGSTLEYDADMGVGGGDRRQGLMTDDIKEILSVDYGSDVKVIIETGGVKHYPFEISSAWCAESDILDGKTEISDKYLQRWEVVPSQEYKVNTINVPNVTMKNKLKHIATLDNNQMATEASFEGFLKWGLSDYSADKMGVIISGHGGGIAGCAYDDNYPNNTLNTAEIALASKNALGTYHRNKFTFLGFDCCLMACADIASVQSEYYEYMVASQEMEDGEGWNQDVWLSYLVQNPVDNDVNILKKAVDSYVGDSHSACGYYEHGQRTPCYSTLSIFDLSKANDFVTSFDSFIDEVGASSSVYANAYRKSYSFGEGSYGLVDFIDFINKVDSLSLTSTTKEAVINSIENMIIYDKNCNGFGCELSGVNLFFPINLSRIDDFAVIKDDYRGSNTKLTSWQLICNSYIQGWH